MDLIIGAHTCALVKFLYLTIDMKSYTLMALYLEKTA